MIDSYDEKVATLKETNKLFKPTIKATSIEAVATLQQAVDSMDIEKIDKLENIVDSCISIMNKDINKSSYFEQILSEIENNDQTPVLKRILDTKNDDLRPLSWWIGLFYQRYSSNQSKYKDIEKWAYKTLWEEHVLKEEKIFSYEKKFDVNNIKLSGNLADYIELKDATVKIEMPVTGKKGKLLDNIAKGMGNANDIDDNSYYGHYYKMIIHYKFKKEYPFTKKENAVKTSLSLKGAKKTYKFTDDWDFGFQNWHWGKKKDYVYEAQIMFPVWTRNQFENADKKWIENVFTAIQPVIDFEETKYMNFKIQTYYNNK